MANTYNSVASPQSAILQQTDLTATTACTTRAPTATASLAGANIVVGLAAASVTSDCRISKISIKGASSSITAPTAGNLVMVWHWDPTAGKAFIFDEIAVTAVTPSTTAASFYGEKVYDDFVLPSGHAIYFAITVTTTASTTAFNAHVHGALL